MHIVPVKGSASNEAQGYNSHVVPSASPTSSIENGHRHIGEVLHECSTYGLFDEVRAEGGPCPVGHEQEDVPGLEVGSKHERFRIAAPQAGLVGGGGQKLKTPFEADQVSLGVAD